ncbi:altered inheritance of mitochondria protein 44 [Folsomia candida]|uniref:altered inheritance of mitochondria protein 44 n=1 Tax=Folsomia candida TaxID=158441 RepID=UPI000B8FBE97|nr:altered inheritance of mitochondria protein 44 [Folsomia candida]XP_021960482.1 altered inheritance of mitochondria protein 44 [Folsomia candida]
MTSSRGAMTSPTPCSTQELCLYCDALCTSASSSHSPSIKHATMKIFGDLHISATDFRYVENVGGLTFCERCAQVVREVSGLIQQIQKYQILLQSKVELLGSFVRDGASDSLTTKSLPVSSSSRTAAKRNVVWEKFREPVIRRYNLGLLPNFCVHIKLENYDHLLPPGCGRTGRLKRCRNVSQSQNLTPPMSKRPRRELSATTGKVTSLPKKRRPRMSKTKRARKPLTEMAVKSKKGAKAASPPSSPKRKVPLWKIKSKAAIAPLPTKRKAVKRKQAVVVEPKGAASDAKKDKLTQLSVQPVVLIDRVKIEDQMKKEKQPSSRKSIPGGASSKNPSPKKKNDSSSPAVTVDMKVKPWNWLSEYVPPQRTAGEKKLSYTNQCNDDDDAEGAASSGNSSHESLFIPVKKKDKVKKEPKEEPNSPVKTSGTNETPKLIVDDKDSASREDATSYAQTDLNKVEKLASSKDSSSVIALELIERRRTCPKITSPLKNRVRVSISFTSSSTGTSHKRSVLAMTDDDDDDDDLIAVDDVKPREEEEDEEDEVQECESSESEDDERVEGEDDLIGRGPRVEEHEHNFEQLMDDVQDWIDLIPPTPEPEKLYSLLQDVSDEISPIPYDIGIIHLKPPVRLDAVIPSNLISEVTNAVKIKPEVDDDDDDDVQIITYCTNQSSAVAAAATATATNPANKEKVVLCVS